jgi:uncharacterized protein (TIGR02391 family)
MNDKLSSFESIVRLAGQLGSPRPESLQTNAELQSHPFDERNIHSKISSVSKKLFDDGHFAQSTFEAFKFLDNEVKRVSGLEDTGFKLMMAAFSEERPPIKLTKLSTESEKDEQKGYRHIFAGAMSSIRNPRGHENLVDPIDLCLDHLSFASFLLRRLENTFP